MAASEVAALLLHGLENAGEVQSKLLENWLGKNAGCEYLLKHGLNGRTDLESFRSCIPVIEFDAVAEDIQRVLQDHTAHILCSEDTTEFLVSSGTSSGKRKVLPLTASSHTATIRFLSYVDHVAAQTLAEETKVTQRALFVYSAGTQTKSPEGLPIGTTTTSVLKNLLSTRPAIVDLWQTPISPAAVLLCEDYEQATYGHLVCGLIGRAQVTEISVAFASGLANFFGNLKQWWEEICNDIEEGKLSSRIKDAALRASLCEVLAKPNQELARSIRAECGKESWKGIALRLWPNLNAVKCTITGSMEQYLDYVESLTGSQIPIWSQVYAASEGYFGMNLRLSSAPREVAYVLVPDCAYYEFLEVSEEENESVLKPVELTAVKEGREYELVVTNFAGLWRYRIGDILKCVGFHRAAPEFRFMRRKNVLLSISTDKTEESELMRVLNAAAKQELPPDAHLLDYTSAASVASIPGHYVIFWELSQGADVSQLEKCCLAIEAGLSEPYRRGRNIGTIAPLELRIVESGSFQKLAQRTGATPGALTWQYKTPRCLKAGSPALEFLEAATERVAWSRQPPPHPTLNP